MPVSSSFLIQVQKAASWTGMWLCLESHCLPLSGSFDWTDRLMHNGLSWRVAAGELCVVFPGLVWYSWAWFGLYQSVVWPHQWCLVALQRKWTDMTYSAALRSGYDVHKTHTCIHTLLSWLHSVLYGLTHMQMHTHSGSVCVYCTVHSTN